MKNAYRNVILEHVYWTSLRNLHIQFVDSVAFIANDRKHGEILTSNLPLRVFKNENIVYSSVVINNNAFKIPQAENIK